MSQNDTSARGQWSQVIMNTYGTPPVELVSGDGAVEIGRASCRERV